ncbi:hypothetical protein VR7878_02226 [Vibrio ruber DSM 16370]|uniref:NLI interacting factor-like phosphatase n=1 Tax=Vibrio ruber (strain DSM 16370 / JCM 11486 / BCRC 17186 / CECT 7878 / LMG 23124 / VR1) TaxID=1123498 RepID=A0A1R4LL39_VIBR1|nr:HAD-IIIC family phosphatase [Vibrio ruber]SJN57292.1 hypothetical protein VR7878_02226 [Vibrio ruber DSM 16370]
MIDKLQLLDFIFEGNASRQELKEYNPVFVKKNYKVSVYRNHSFELVSNVISPFLDLSEIGITFEYSDYDDSLTFFNLDLESDLMILWLDLSRYTNNEYESFIKERLEALKKMYAKNILFVNFGRTINLDDNRICLYNIDRWEIFLNSSYIDERLERFSGTKMSMKTCELVARDLGLNYIPALLQPNLKCIVVDLDNTLYNGVLGEDGIYGISISESHVCLQSKLKQLAKDGVFLCIASKNDERDVIELFEKRKDFPLEKSDFTYIEANWNSKSISIRKIEEYLNINSSSFLFIDDNIGELLSVFNEHPQIKFIHAKDDASITLRALENYPGLLKLNINKEDTIRKADVEANSKRQELLNTVSKDEYIKSLGMELDYAIDDHDRVDRISELANKTNQFIFSYQRYSKAEVNNLMSSHDSTVVSVSLRDKLSDSGIIGVIILKLIDTDSALLEECFVSCRALGRGIDRDIVLGAIDSGLKKLNVEKLKVQYKNGERNSPAVKFINDYLYKHIDIENKLEFSFDNVFLKLNVKL